MFWIAISLAFGGFVWFIAGTGRKAHEPVFLRRVTIFENLGQWVSDAIVAFGYAGLALFLLIENLFLPIPSEVVLPLAGFLVGRATGVPRD